MATGFRAGAVLFMPRDSDPAVVLQARNNLKAITVGIPCP
jgi:hypothetical protein